MSAHLRTRRQRLVELVLGLPRGSLTTEGAQVALASLTVRLDHEIAVRDQQIHRLRSFMLNKPGLMAEFWRHEIETQDLDARERRAADAAISDDDVTSPFGAELWPTLRVTDID